MASIVKTVSVTPDEEVFLKDYNLSPTQLLKEKIWEMRGMIRNLTQNKIQKMAAVIQEQADKIGILENALEKENPTT